MRPVAWTVPALLGFLVYANSLGNQMVLDDFAAIVDNPAAHDPLAWRRVLLGSSWMTGIELEGFGYRPLTTWTFALNHAVHGISPAGYHVVNVLAHAAVAVLVTALAAALGLSLATAGLAGVLFAVHPVHTEAVANVVGRAEILSAGFVLVALLAYHRAFVDPRPLVSGLLALVAYALALLAKENAIALLALFPLAEMLRTRAVPRRVGWYAGMLLVTIGWLALRRVAVGSVLGTGEIELWQNPAASQPTPLRMLTALHVSSLALRMLAFPIHLSADYYYRVIRPIGSPLEPAAILGLVAAAGVVVLAALLRRRPVALFWLAFGMLAWLPVSNLPFPIGTIFGERLLYLPSVGACVLLAMAISAAARRWDPRLAAGIALALVLGWSVRTIVRNRVWHDPSSLAEATVRDAPESAHAHALLGAVHAEAGRSREAVAAFSQALAIDPDYVDALFDLGAVQMQLGAYDEALGAFRRVVTLQPRRFGAWVNIAAIHGTRGDLPAALEAADAAVALQPGTPNGHVMRGFALRGLGRLAEARSAFEQALRLPNVQPDALLGLGATALDQGDVQRATATFERLVTLAPSAEAYGGLVAAYQRAGREEEAARAAATARARFPVAPPH